MISELTLPLVITAAAVDAINPCAFAVLIVLLGVILVARERAKVLRTGLAFTASIYISYFLMGFGAYSALQISGLMTQKIYRVVAILAIVIGLLQIKDFFWYGKGPTTEVPYSWRPKLKKLVGGVTSVPGAFFVGFGVSLFLLPCTSGPYIVILGLLAKESTRTIASFLLLLYNFIFIIPMIIITLLIFKGVTTTARAEAFRQRRLRAIHLITGIVMIGMGLVIMIALG